MLSRAFSCAVSGLDGQLVTVEIDVTRGLPAVTVVGLPDAAVQESRERVRSAVRNSGLTFPPNHKVVVALAPADLRKEGPAYDLPIAAGILLASGQLTHIPEESVIVGELALTGEVRPVRGMLPMAALAKRVGKHYVFCPAANAAEAALVDGITVYPVDTLASLASHFLGAVLIAPYDREAQPPPVPMELQVTDFADILGQEHAKRALEVAAAGGHNLLMRGSPGTGKTLLARALPSILPPMNQAEAMEVTQIYSVAGMLPAGAGLMTARPFRSPHHTISNAGLVGGGSPPKPGEVTLAHRGILFLDELPEFDPRSLEVLRQPLEDRMVHISRAKYAVSYPCNFSLIASMNPCQCGYRGDPARECTCAAFAAARYSRRISGPLLDRIDLFVDVPRVEFEKLAAPVPGERSAAVAQRVQVAREVQTRRFQAAGVKAHSNAEMTPPMVRELVQATLDPRAVSVLQVAVERLKLSARSFHRLLKLSRTIADLDGADDVATSHVAEAIQYRERLE